MGTWMGDSLGTPGAAGRPNPSSVVGVKQIHGNLFQGKLALGKSVLQNGPPEYLNGPDRGTMKKANS